MRHCMWKHVSISEILENELANSMRVSEFIACLAAYGDPMTISNKLPSGLASLSCFRDRPNSHCWVLDPHGNRSVGRT